MQISGTTSIGAMFKQSSNNFLVTIRSSQVERRYTVVLCCIGIGFVVQKELHEFEKPFLSRAM